MFLRRSRRRFARRRHHYSVLSLVGFFCLFTLGLLCAGGLLVGGFLWLDGGLSAETLSLSQMPVATRLG